MCRFLSLRELLFAQEVGTQFGGLQVYLCICTCVFVFVYFYMGLYLCICILQESAVSF